ncbi:MAG: TonB-dependent receptor [Bacteroidota bacterium]
MRKSTTLNRVFPGFGFLLLLIAAVVLVSQPLVAQETGIIKGRVFDKGTGDALPYANIVIVGTAIGAASDISGHFTLNAVPAGTHSLRVGYVGYETVTRDVTVNANSTLETEVGLSAQAIEGETIVVTGQAKGQLAAINQQLSSNNIVNVVSADKMKELPDANLAESIGRLPGVSIQREAGEATKIVVRGLSPKFNRVTVEGVPMVSTSNQDRSIDLSLIGDDLIKGVELSKSLRPDLDADAIGGTVNLTLREAPEGFHYDANANGGYNDLHKDWKNYKFTASASDRFFDNALGARLQISLEQKQLPSDQFAGTYSSPTTLTTIDTVNNTSTNSWYISTQSALLTQILQRRIRNGGSAIFDYKSDLMDLSLFNLWSQKNDDQTSSANTISFLNAGADGRFSRRYADTKYRTEERTHSLQSLFKFGDTRLSLSAAYTKGKTSAPQTSFPLLELVGSGTSFSANALKNAQPAGLIAAMGPSNPANTWIQNFELYDVTLLDENYDGKADYKIPFTLTDDLSGTVSVGGKFHGVRRESAGSGLYAYFQYGAGKAFRDNLVKYFPWVTYDPSGQHGIPVTSFMDASYDPGTFLKGRYALDWSASIPLLNATNLAFHNIPGITYWQYGQNDYQNDYNSLEDTYAAYGMAEFNMFDNRLTVLPGIRFEREWTRYSAYSITINGSNSNGLQGIPVQLTSTRKNDLWFPSVNVKYKLTDDIQLMGAVYKSEAKPDFLQISPLIIYNGVTSIGFQAGNPFLTPATAINYDVSVSLFSNEIGLLTVGAFYKEISNLVVSLANYQPYKNSTWFDYPADLPGRVPALAYYDTSWFHNNPTAAATIPMNNPEKAYIRGIEFSWQTHFWYLPGVLTGLVLDLNLSFIGSNTQYPYFNTVTIGYTTGRVKVPITALQYTTRAGAVVDQPKSIANVILGWDYKGFSTRFSLRYQQTTLTSLDSKFSLADAYYDNFLLLDISAKQQILDNLSIFANFTNLTSHIDDYYIDAVGGRLPTSSQAYGLRGQFGVSYSY